MTAFQLEKSESVGTLTFDLPGEKVNKLTSDVMAQLSQLLTQIGSDPTIKALVIKSNKPNIFIAGADIREIEDITTSNEGAAKAQNGQKILDQLEALPIPTIAAIDGAALGGGLELALACTFRLVSDNPKTSLGLPEVNLGIIPGFGGTQRLPRLIGIPKALPMILTGKPVNGPKAEKLKLADKCINQSFFDRQVRQIAQQLTNPKTAEKWRQKRQLKTSQKLLESFPVSRQLIFNTARKSVLKKSKGHYPAPLSAITAIQKGTSKSLANGLKIEIDEFARLVPTHTSKNLIQLFYSNEALKKYSGPVALASKPVFRAAGVLGAGFMGGGIGWLMSKNKLSVRLKDISWDAIRAGYEAASKSYAARLKRRRITKSEMSMGLNRLSGTLDYSGFEHLDIVIEAIVENVEIKQKVLAETEAHLPDHALLATNTSSLSITELAKNLKRPEQFVGIHFFSPVDRMPLVEIIPGDKTSDETVSKAIAFIKTMGKTPVVVQNCPGFLVNRILLPYVNEAVRCLQDGIDLSFIDQTAEQFGMPLGPLNLADEVGLDVGIKVGKILESVYPDRMKLPSKFEAILDDPSCFGKKTNKGFYVYSGKEKRPNTDLINRLRSGSTAQNGAKEDVLDRLMLIMVNEAARCIDESIVASPEFLDMAMIMGTGFPPFRGGLCRYADQQGIGQVVQRLTALASRYGERFAPAPRLTTMADASEIFYSKGETTNGQPQ